MLDQESSRRSHVPLIIKSSSAVRDNVCRTSCVSDCLLNHRKKIEIKCPYDDRWWEKLVCCILSERRSGRMLMVLQADTRVVLIWTFPGPKNVQKQIYFAI
ncbi:hypothetical protein Zmor_010661 [Zophobas morio]|uniref:Uncharacterized protein n=1 Tax=Zophobas morio TaxID=2755281 RepID=A0AA38IT94_9CUCU|nr:hypothetical protein Zmor_010661 [Zophobas morio]